MVRTENAFEQKDYDNTVEYVLGSTGIQITAMLQYIFELSHIGSANKKII